MHAFVDFITQVKLISGYSTDGSTTTFVTGVSTNVWRRFCISRHRCFSTI